MNLNHHYSESRVGFYTGFFVLLLFISCSDNQVEPTVVQTGLPEVLTGEVTNRNSTSATVSGQVVSDGNSQVTERGIVIGVNPEPTVGDFKFTSGNGKGSFSVEIAGLQTGTTYQVRAYASNAKGTSYGVNKSFNTTDLNPIYLDANGITVKCYDWAKVGDKGTLNGKEYLIVDREQLMARILAGWDCSTLCTTKVEDMSGIFTGYLFLDESEISSWDVSNVYNMSSMFSSSSFNGDISAWDVNNVSSMSNMFGGSMFNGDISNWDVSKVTLMDGLFAGTKFNGDISQWDVSNVNTMSWMFAGSTFNNDISKWNVGRVIYMDGMFYNSAFNNDISNWDVSNVYSMNDLFNSSLFSGDISNWNVGHVNSAVNMFAYSKFNGDISKWDVSNVNDMSQMFFNGIFDGDISRWDVSGVTIMAGMFRYSQFNGNIGGWNVSNVTNMLMMFEGAQFNSDISLWDVSKVDVMQYMFLGNKAFNQDLSNWNVGRVSSCSGFSSGADNWTLPQPNFTNCQP